MTICKLDLNHGSGAALPPFAYLPVSIEDCCEEDSPLGTPKAELSSSTPGLPNHTGQSSLNRRTAEVGEQTYVEIQTWRPPLSTTVAYTDPYN